MNFILKWKYTLGGLVLGIAGGFLYWNFIGCADGTCIIQSNMYIMTGYGALMGFFVGNVIQGFDKPKVKS